MQPLLSIVIPIYNNERTLKKMVDSILIQKFDNWELLLVNDGSTDSCPQIIDDYAKSDNRIKAFHKQNGGTYSGYNLGLKCACGKYIMFVGADDTFEPIAFETIYEQTQEYDYDIIFIDTNIIACDNDYNTLNNIRIIPLMESPLKIISKVLVQKHWLSFTKSNFVQYLYKLDILKDYQYREDIHNADMFMIVETADKIHSVSVSHKSLYNWYLYYQPQQEHTNISQNKYYPYLHDVHNEIYIQYKQLHIKWKNLDNDTLTLLKEIRLQRFIEEINLIFAPNNKNTPSENANELLNMMDDTIFEAAVFGDYMPEIDNRIFSTIGVIIKENQIKNNFGNPIVRIITAINNTTISVDEIKLEITNGLLDYRNPYRIGFETYKTLSENNTQIADFELLNYLETELTARKQLFTGNLEQALDTTIQLFNSKISTPEQYVILALCGYHLGLTEDAQNAVETGLQLFPNYPRLEELQNIINTERNE
ncbi:MAG: glycosyltransferase [Firmicutes bacterium]|nr:glycosyltransferase [Bacillota bacterium]